MTYIYKTVWSGSEIVAEYCYSSLHNKIKVVELTVDGKFHRTNWMGPIGREKLLGEWMSDGKYSYIITHLIPDRVCVVFAWYSCLVCDPPSRITNQIQNPTHMIRWIYSPPPGVNMKR